MIDVVELGARGFLRGGEAWEPAEAFYAVLGDPVDHSLSPGLQSAALADRELAWEYLALRVPAGEVARLKTPPFRDHLAGFNVTAPHKEAAAALCEARTDQARILGAVNAVKVEDGRWLGHNTDSGGVLSVLCEAWPSPQQPAEVVVLGTGGSARAAVDAAVRWGVPRVRVCGRSSTGRERYAGWLKRCDYGAEISVVDLADAPRRAPTEPAVWICCLAGGVSATPWLPVAAGDAPALLLDLRYGAQRPADPAPLGFGVVDGLPVLLMQGGLSFAWWFGPPVPWTAMRAALPLAG